MEKMEKKPRTSSAVKQKYNRRHYDRLTLLMPKGYKDKVKAYAKEKGVTVNGLVNEIGRELVGVSPEEWKPLYVDPE